MLQTERLYLRNFYLSDVTTLWTYRNDNRCNLYQRYDGTSKAYLEEFVQTYAHSTYLSREPEQHYAIARSADREMIGDLSVFFTEKDNCFTLGLTIAPAFQRQGYSYELLQELTTQLQTRYPGVDIVALIDKENTPSICLFQKLGFTEECYAESIQSYVFTIYGHR